MKAQRTAKESGIMGLYCSFVRSLEHYAKKSNEIRFYRDILTSDLALRKSILSFRQTVNFAGLVMDKSYFSFEEWSTLINRIFSSYSNLAHILHQFQTALERLCKANQNIKQIKETLNRVTMTTLAEGIVHVMCSLERHFDHDGKHIVEERLPNKSVAASKTATQTKPKTSVRVDKMESPLTLMTRYCEEQNQVDVQNESKYASQVSNSRTPHKLTSPIVMTEKTDPYLEKMREKK